MRTPKTPQAKKRLSLLKDCQNTYGEHDKSSRTSIRWRKSWVNRTYRRDVNQSLGEATADLVRGASLEENRLTDRAQMIDRHQWQKCADMPLGEKLLRDKTWEIGKLLTERATSDSDLLDKLARYLCVGGASLKENRDLKSGRIAIIIRRIRAVILDHNSAILNLTWEDLTLLGDFLLAISN